MIRKINLNEVSQIYEIEKENFSNFELYKNIEKLIHNNNYLIVGNFENEILISYIIGIRMSDQYELLKIATRKNKQNNGFASELFKNVSKKFKEVFLEVNEKNLNAIKFYEHLGFQKNGVRKAYYNNKDNAINLVYKNY